MAALIGSLQPYNFASDLKLYELSITNFFAANRITAPANSQDIDRRKAALLATIGMRALDIIRSLCALDEPNTKSYDEIIELLRSHYTKAPTKSLARQKLAAVKQNEDESIDEFIARMCHLAIDCQHGGAMLTEVLQVQFINGIRAEAFKKKLLAAENETLDQLLARARSFEQVERDVRAFRQNVKQETNSSETNFFNKVNSSKPNASAFRQISRPGMKNGNFQNVGFRIPSNCVNCYRCGGSNHNSSVCWYKDKICNYCGKLAHKAIVCHSAHKQRTSQPLHNAPEHSRIKQHNAQHQLKSETETNSFEEPVNSLTSPRLPAHHVNVKENGHNLQLEFDTGSANTVVSERVWRSLCAPYLSTPPQIIAYKRFSIPVLGSAQVTAKFKEKVKH